MTLPARRPWWKKKRWAAAVALWLLVVVYPLSAGPAAYASARGWTGDGFATFNALYGPLEWAIERTGSSMLIDAYVSYQAWWGNLASQRASD